MAPIIFWIVSGIVLVHLLNYLIVYRKIIVKSKPFEHVQPLQISVIVYFKNQQDRVEILLDKLFAQNYISFEIVAVDHDSIDETLLRLEEYQLKNPNLKIVKAHHIEAFWGNKKFALTLGIKAAKHEHLLFIDADFEPVSTDWIHHFAACYSENKSIVLGYSSYKPEKTFLNLISRFENVLQHMQFLGLAKLGKPYKGLGANLGYRRSEFYRVRGFNDHIKIRGGVDELFINQAANAKNTNVCVHPDAITLRTSFKNYMLWSHYKRQQLDFVEHFKAFEKNYMRFWNLNWYAFFILLPVLWITEGWIWALPLLLVRYMVTWIVFGKTCAYFREPWLVFYYPLLELYWLFTFAAMKFTNLFSKPIP
jgi:glycosyltransferase involved in cell wall biosynthesis